MTSMRALPRTMTLYRPSVPGHAHCTTHRTPASIEAELAPLDYDMNFGWNLFTVYNDILVEELLRTQDLNTSTDGAGIDEHDFGGHPENAAMGDDQDLEEMGLRFRRRSRAIGDEQSQEEDDKFHIAKKEVLLELRPSVFGPRPRGYLPIFQRSLLRPECVLRFL
jgi:hypothetical protein